MRPTCPPRPAETGAARRRRAPVRNRPLLAAGLAALAVLATACGDDDDAGSDTTTAVTSAPAAETTDPAAVTTAPEATVPATSPPTSGPAGGDCPAEPTVEDAAFLVGLTEDEAADAAEECGWTIRAVVIDGEDQAVTLDLRPNRVNVEVTDSEVTAIVDVG